jgi:hypothetical protein
LYSPDKKNKGSEKMEKTATDRLIEKWEREEYEQDVKMFRYFAWPKEMFDAEYNNESSE